MTQFLKIYYSPASDDSDGQTQQLTQYLASNLTLPSTDKNTDLKLISSTLNGIFTMDTVKTGQLILQEPVNKECKMWLKQHYSLIDRQTTKFSKNKMISTVAFNPIKFRRQLKELKPEKGLLQISLIINIMDKNNSITN